MGSVVARYLHMNPELVFSTEGLSSSRSKLIGGLQYVLVDMVNSLCPEVHSRVPLVVF